jgi:hypothetical protein
MGSAFYFRSIQQDNALAVEGQRPTWGQHPISGSHNKITHSLWKDKGRHGVSILFQVHTTSSRTSCERTKADMWSASHFRFIQQDHALPVERQRSTWGQHPISGSYNKSTHFLWKDKGRRGVSIPIQVHTTSSRTCCGRTKVDVWSASYFTSIQQDHTLPVEGYRPTWISIPLQVDTTRSPTCCGRTKAVRGLSSN